MSTFQEVNDASLIKLIGKALVDSRHFLQAIIGRFGYGYRFRRLRLVCLIHDRRKCIQKRSLDFKIGGTLQDTRFHKPLGVFFPVIEKKFHSIIFLHDFVEEIVKASIFLRARLGR